MVKRFELDGKHYVSKERNGLPCEGCAFDLPEHPCLQEQEADIPDYTDMVWVEEQCKA